MKNDNCHVRYALYHFHFQTVKQYGQTGDLFTTSVIVMFALMASVLKCDSRFGPDLDWREIKAQANYSQNWEYKIQITEKGKIFR